MRLKPGDFVVVFIGAFTVVLLMSFCSSCKNLTGEAHKESEAYARQYAKDLGMEAKGVTCAGMDTDNDGYISCTLATTDGRLIAIECAGAAYMNSGCRIPKLQAAIQDPQ